MDIAAEQINSLAAKIDSLDLTDAERAILDEVFERARTTEPEVEGYYIRNADIFGAVDASSLTPTARRLFGDRESGFMTGDSDDEP